MNATRHTQSDASLSGHAAHTLYNLVYCSRATADIDEEAVARIIESSRRQNAVDGITGLLVFGGGVFSSGWKARATT